MQETHMNRITLFCLLVLSLNTTATAETTICKMKIEGFNNEQTISWNSETKSGQLIDFLGNEQTGEVTNIREKDDNFKINILFEHRVPYYGADLTEYIIFPVNNIFRIIGVTYKIIENDKHLDTIQGTYKAECVLLQSISNKN